MPHDRNGQLVEVGDVVKGTGYNIKHEIIGEVVGVTPDSEACNIQVATCQVSKYLMGNGFVHNNTNGEAKLLSPLVEYGACKDFEIIQKAEKAA